MESHLSFTCFTGKRLHLGICGSIACYKALDLVRRWRDAGVDVGATLTDSAQRFVTPLAFEALGASPVYASMFGPESAAGADRDVFPHLSPGESAHAFAIVAASATTMARLAHGLGDEILSCQALAFSGPMVIAPAMNPRMWANQATQANWETLRQRGYQLVEPVCGRVACMDEGSGRLADPRDIYLAALKALSPQDFAGRTVMLTMGPTREHWDGIRFWSNPATGTMGAALAVAAYLRGATVHAICGPGGAAGEPWLPAAITRHSVTGAKEMFAVADGLWPTMDVGIFNAAVADFSPVPWGLEKFKKTSAEDGFSVNFTPNPDILKTLATRKKNHQKVIGFAAETSDLQTHVLSKLASKNADMLVGNIVSQAGAGFGGTENAVFIADAQGRTETLPTMGKADRAWKILAWLSRL